MEPLVVLVAIFVVGSSLWVGMDAWGIGARKGLMTGLVDMGPVGWTLACLLMWIIAFPIYLANRGDIKRAAAAAGHGAQVGGPERPPGSPAYQPAFRIDEPRPWVAQTAQPPQYWVRLAGGELGPFLLSRLQEFVGTGQLKWDTPVRGPDQVVIPAVQVPGLSFGRAPRSLDQEPSTASADGGPGSLPAAGGPADAGAAGAGAAGVRPSGTGAAGAGPTYLGATGSPPTGPGAAGAIQAATGPARVLQAGMGPARVLQAELRPAVAPSVPPPRGNAFPPSPLRAPTVGGAGSSTGVIAMLGILAVLVLVSLVLRHTVPGPKEAWEYKVDSAEDGRFEYGFNDLGKKGWEMVSCRRALVTDPSGSSKRDYRYECILKRRAGSTSTD